MAGHRLQARRTFNEKTHLNEDLHDDFLEFVAFSGFFFVVGRSKSLGGLSVDTKMGLRVGKSK
jgi:hypothetical protein